jgi:hypothetical protein
LWHNAGIFITYTYIIHFSHFVFIGYICFSLHTLIVGRDSSVCIATGYGLDGPKSNSGAGKIFRTCTDWSWGPPKPLYNGYRVFPGSKERPERDAEPSPPSSAVGHERVELYLYYPYGPYSLYRASVPVERCTLHLPFLHTLIMFYAFCTMHCNIIITKCTVSKLIF